MADRIETAQAAGLFRLLVGRVRDYAEQGGSVTVFYRPRGKEQPERLEAARAINCAGPSAEYERMPDPLVRSLLANGTARPDPLRLGLDVTTNCACCTATAASLAGSSPSARSPREHSGK